MVNSTVDNLFKGPTEERGILHIITSYSNNRVLIAINRDRNFKLMRIFAYYTIYIFKKVSSVKCAQFYCKIKYI